MLFTTFRFSFPAGPVNKQHFPIALLGLLTILIAAGLPPLHAQDATRDIEHVAGDVYRFQNNNHYSLVTVTEDSVVIVDPINQSAASWLLDNLASITDKPISHLIYSHSHGDHASGGQVLVDAGATTVAQSNAPDAIDGVAIDQRFDDKTTLEIGGKSFELTYLGPGHGEDLIAVVVRPENVAFITDAAAPKRLPFRDFGGANIDDWIEQVKVVESLDFEIFAPAHGNVGVKQDAAGARIYLETLRERVLAGLNEGKNVDELIAAITLDEYRDWLAYDSWREANIRGMARFLTESGQVN